jgi:hypothetical protein
MNSELLQKQDTEYIRSIQSDRLVHNENVLKEIKLFISEKEEKDRVKRIDYLNSLSPSKRREFITRPVTIEDTISQKYLNKTDQEVSEISSDDLLVYTISDEYNFAYSLIELVESDCIKLDDNNNITLIELPITINTNLTWYVQPELDNQWDYTLLQHRIQDYKEKLKKSQLSQKYERIKTLVTEKLLMFGFDNFAVTDESIDNYLKSGYPENKIIEKLVESIIDQQIE